MPIYYSIKHITKAIIFLPILASTLDKADIINSDNKGNLPANGKYLIDTVQCSSCECEVPEASTFNCTNICQSFKVGRGQSVQNFFTLLQSLATTCRVHAKVQIPTALSVADYCSADDGVVIKKPALAMVIDNPRYRQALAHVYPGCGNSKNLVMSIGGGLLSPSKANCILPREGTNTFEEVRSTSTDEFVEVPLGIHDLTMLPKPLDPNVRNRTKDQYETRRDEPLDMTRESLFAIQNSCLKGTTGIVFIHDVQGYFYGTKD